MCVQFGGCIQINTVTIFHQSQGYVSRSSNGPLPPFDPYVEVDPPTYRVPQTDLSKPNQHLSNGAIKLQAVVPRTSGGHKGRLLTRSSDIESHSAPTSFDSETVKMGSSRWADTPRSKTPTPPLRRLDAHHDDQRTNLGPSRHHDGMNSEPTNVSPIGVISEPSYAHNGTSHNGPLPPNATNDVSGYIMKNGDVLSPTNDDRLVHNITRQPPLYNSRSSSASSDPRVKPVPKDRRKSLDILEPTKSVPFYKEVLGKMPQGLIKGQHKCQRCARRFTNKAEYSDHKARCIS